MVFYDETGLVSIVGFLELFPSDAFAFYLQTSWFSSDVAFGDIVSDVVLACNARQNIPHFNNVNIFNSIL